MTRGTDVTDFRRTYKTAVHGEFLDETELLLKKEFDLRYGENPSQPAAIYRLKWHSLPDKVKISVVKDGKDGLSATNIMDVTRALDILKFFTEPSVTVMEQVEREVGFAIMKHAIPSGFATRRQTEGLDRLYIAARDADARSAFGSVVVSNTVIDKATAEALTSTFVEVVAAPEYEEGVTAILGKKNDLRVILFSGIEDIPKFTGDDVTGLYDPKFLPTGRVILQKPYLSSIRSERDLICDPLVRKDGLEYVVQRDPTPQEAKDMRTAWHIAIGVRSNAVVLVKDGVAVIGSGQQERIGALEQAAVKGYQKAMDRLKIKYDPLMGIRDWPEDRPSPLKGAVCSSDGFVPFSDSIKLLARIGVEGLVQPGGSVNDCDVIQAVNKYKMAMAFTLERCFGHF